jgi:hypothetical protein|tara:strand:- start:1692 stop:1943 length:252 start_codon:yes stop_codon:yes gene_type:complete
MNNQFFSINLVKKKATTKKSTKSTKSSKTSKSTKKRKSTKKTDSAELDSGIVIVDDDFDVDKDVVNEERRAYLEEARSQDAAD